MNPSIFKKTRFLILNFALSIATMSIGTAQALTALNSPANFSGNETLIEFEGLVLDSQVTNIGDVDFLLVGTQNDGLGAGSQVSDIMLVPREFEPKDGKGIIDPYPGVTFFPFPAPVLQLTFGSLINRLGFEMRTTQAPVDITVHCMSNGVVVDTITFPAPPSQEAFDWHFHAFESVNSFDEILISVGDDSGWNMDNLRFESFVPQYTSVGFEAPMDNGPVSVKGNRALPLKAVISDEDGYPITDADIFAVPLAQVMFVSASGGSAIDVTGDALPAGLGTDGNTFEFSNGQWRFNLKTKNYSATGTYTIKMLSGDPSEYQINPACQVQFQRD